MHYLPLPGRIRFRTANPDLTVHYPNIEAAKAAYPSCERTALRAFTRSEAARLANKLIGPAKRWSDSFINVVEMFADPSRVSDAALRQRRFDFVVMLMQSGRFERRIARRLVREGKLSAGWAA